MPSHGNQAQVPCEAQPWMCCPDRVCKRSPIGRASLQLPLRHMMVPSKLHSLVLCRHDHGLLVIHQWQHLQLLLEALILQENALKGHMASRFTTYSGAAVRPPPKKNHRYALPSAKGGKQTNGRLFSPRSPRKLSWDHGLCHPCTNSVLSWSAGVKGLRSLPWLTCHYGVAPFGQASKGGGPVRVLKSERSATQYGHCFSPWVFIVVCSPCAFPTTEVPHCLF